jgi:cold shock CspA family protein
MSNGTVKCFSNQKGYGFIHTDDGENFFYIFTQFKPKDLKPLGKK